MALAKLAELEVEKTKVSSCKNLSLKINFPHKGISDRKSSFSECCFTYLQVYHNDTAASDEYQMEEVTAHTAFWGDGHTRAGMVISFYINLSFNKCPSRLVPFP